MLFVKEQTSVQKKFVSFFYIVRDTAQPEDWFHKAPKNTKHRKKSLPVKKSNLEKIIFNTPFTARSLNHASSYGGKGLLRPTGGQREFFYLFVWCFCWL